MLMLVVLPISDLFSACLAANVLYPGFAWKLLCGNKINEPGFMNKLCVVSSFAHTIKLTHGCSFSNYELLPRTNHWDV